MKSIFEGFCNTECNDYICLINVTKLIFVGKKIVGFSNELMWVYALAYSPTFFIFDTYTNYIKNNENFYKHLKTDILATHEHWSPRMKRVPQYGV